MSQHTPGPWEASAWSSVKGGELIALGWSITANGHLLPLSACAAFDDDILEPQANARLIAAAPELLEALLALVDEYEPNLKAFATDAPRKAKWMSALAALAKATGSAA